MLRLGGVAVVSETSPLIVTPEASQVVVGPLVASKGKAGVPRVASSTSVQLRLPLPPCPACANQSRPKVPSVLSTALLTSCCIEIEPSEQVVWLWMSPARYFPEDLSSRAVVGIETTAPAAIAVA